MIPEDDEELQQKAKELDEQYDSGIGTFGLPEDDVNGMVWIFKAAEVDFEFVPELSAIYFDYPEQSPAGNGGSNDVQE